MTLYIYIYIYNIQMYMYDVENQSLIFGSWIVLRTFPG